jgi:hypothetical protein
MEAKLWPVLSNLLKTVLPADRVCRIIQDFLVLSDVALSSILDRGIAIKATVKQDVLHCLTVWLNKRFADATVRAALPRNSNCRGDGASCTRFGNQLFSDAVELRGVILQVLTAFAEQDRVPLFHQSTMERGTNLLLTDVKRMLCCHVPIFLAQMKKGQIDGLAKSTVSMLWTELPQLMAGWRVQFHADLLWQYSPAVTVEAVHAALIGELISVTPARPSAKHLYYVYAYLDLVDLKLPLPLSQAVFYIGKGTGPRCFSHIVEACKPGKKKATKIQQLWAERRGPRIVRLTDCVSEDVALTIEDLLVRSNVFPNLTNAPNKTTNKVQNWSDVPQSTRSRWCCQALSLLYAVIRHLSAAEIPEIGPCCYLKGTPSL